MSSDVANVYVGAQANDGTGDPIRTAFQTVNSNFYNLDNRISTGNIAVIFSTVGVTAQTFVSNSYSHTQTLEVYQTANIAGNAQIGNLAVNNAFTASSITSTGNTRAIGGLVVNGPAHFGNNLVIVGNLTVLGNSATVSSQDLAIQDSIIQLHTPADLSPLTTDDGKDIGIAFHYYKGADKAAALIWANDSQSLEFYASGNETAANVWSGTYGNVKVGSLFLANTTQSSSATTGALIARGGIATQSNAFVGGNLQVTGNTQLQSANVKQLSVSGSVVGSMYLYGSDTIYVNGSPVATSAASFTGGTVPSYTIFSSNVDFNSCVNIKSGTTSISTSTGALIVTGGVGISGNLYVGGGFSVSGLDNTPIGSTTASTGKFTTLVATGNIVAASATESTGVTTGALVVKGGVGINGNLFVGGSINNTSIGVYGAAVGNFLSIGASSAGTGIFTTLRATANLFANSGTVSTSVSTGAAVVVGGLGVSGTIYAGNIIIPNGGTLTGTVSGDISGNIATNYATTTNFSTGNARITGGNIVVNYLTPTNISTGNAQITGGNSAWTTAAATNFSSGNASISGGNGAFTTLTATNLSSGNLQVSGTIKPNANATINLGSTSAYWGNVITNGMLVGSGGILPNGNATVDIGSSTAWFGNIYGVSSQAKYADLAENYIADTPCTPGMVVVFGGEAEITTTTTKGDTRVAGVISTNPAYLMNADCYQGQPVALRGRVPVYVIGKVAKGDLLVSSETAGYACSVKNDRTYGPAIFAKSLNDKDDDGAGQIEAVII